MGRRERNLFQDNTKVGGMKVALVSTGIAVALALTAAAVKRSRDQVNERAAASRKPASRKTSAARG